MKWNDSYRKLFFDFHNWAENHSLAADFDAERFAEDLEYVGCQLVSVFALGGKGHRYYRKGEYGVIHPHLPEGLDMVEDVVRECHKRKIQVLGYVGYGMNREFLLEHPDFIQRNADGSYADNPFSGIRACKIGYATDYLIQQYVEICSNYALDYFFLDGSYVNEECFCPYCRENFKKDTGHDLPLSREGRLWKIYLNWFHGKMEEQRYRVRGAVHAARPGIQAIVNWSNTYRSPDPVADNVDMLFGDVPFPNEMEGIDICARSFALTGHRYEIHNTAFLKSWGEWGLKHPTVLKRSAALLLANGTNVHMGYQFYPRFHVEQGVWNAFKEVFDWVKPREEYLRNNEIQPYIGAYYSNKQHGLTHTGDIWSEPQWLYGFNKLMIDSGLHYNMLSTEYMAETIEQFSAVFLPDMRYVSDEELTLIEGYVRGGGTLIVTGLGGTADEYGEYTRESRFSEILGIRWEGVSEEAHSYMRIIDPILAENTSDMPLSMEAVFAKVGLNGAEKLASLYDLYKNTKGENALRYSPPQNDTGFAAVTYNRYGRGQAVFFAQEISQAYYQTFQWNLVEIVKNLLFKTLKIEERVRVSGDGSCEITLAKRGEATQVHLVNMAGTMPNTMHVKGYCMPREVITMSDVPVEVLHHCRPSKVIMRPQNLELPFTADGNKAIFRIPKVGLYEILEVY